MSKRKSPLASMTGVVLPEEQLALGIDEPAPAKAKGRAKKKAAAKKVATKKKAVAKKAATKKVASKRKPKRTEPEMVLRPRQVYKTPRTRRNHKGILIHVPLEIHAQIVEICKEEDITQVTLMREAMNLVLKEYRKTPAKLR